VKEHNSSEIVYLDYFVGTAILILGALCSEKMTTCPQMRRTWKASMMWTIYRRPLRPWSQLWRPSALGAAR